MDSLPIVCMSSKRSSRNHVSRITYPSCVIRSTRPCRVASRTNCKGSMVAISVASDCTHLHYVFWSAWFPNQSSWRHRHLRPHQHKHVDARDQIFQLGRQGLALISCSIASSWACVCWTWYVRSFLEGFVCHGNTVDSGLLWLVAMSPVDYLHLKNVGYLAMVGSMVQPIYTSRPACRLTRDEGLTWADTDCLY
jgi:hypothetical protein